MLALAPLVQENADQRDDDGQGEDTEDGATDDGDG